MRGCPQAVPLRFTTLNFALALAAFWLGACSDSTSGSSSGSSTAPEWKAGSTDLLARYPDSFPSQPGHLAPEPGQGWGVHHLRGWKHWTGSDKDGAPFTWSTEKTAGLLLPAAEPTERNLRLRLFGPRPLEGSEFDADQSMSLQLNGHDLGSFPLSPSPQWLELPVAAELWRAGSNELLFEVSHTIPGADGTELGLALAEVRYDTPLNTVDIQDRRLRLPVGSQVLYGLELVQPADITVGAVAQAAGLLELQWRQLGQLDSARGAWNPIGRIIAEVPQRFERSFELKAVGSVELQLLWTSPAAHALDVECLRLIQAGPKLPPIIFISLDTLAARHTSLGGYSIDTTPHLRELAKESVVFENCRSNAPWTLPSYISQFTGLYAGSAAFDSELTPTDDRWWKLALSQRRWTLAESLRARGYRTAAFTGSGWFAAGFGMEQGFDVYENIIAAPRARDRFLAGLSERGLEWLGTAELDSQNANPIPPPFLFINAIDVHSPYQPDPQFTRRIDASLPDEPEDLRPVAAPHRFGCISEEHVGMLVEGPSVPAVYSARDLARAYDAEVLQLDQALADFITELKAKRWFDASILIITSDHGESMREHDWLFEHGLNFGEISHVPLLIRFPSGQYGGRRIETGVQLVDLMPTLFEAAGMQQRPGLHGRSLMPLVRGESMPETPLFSQRDYLVGESLEWKGWKLIATRPGKATASTLHSHSLAREWVATNVTGLDLDELLAGNVSLAQLRAMRRAGQDPAQLPGQLREALEGPRYQLFDLARDPGEITDLAQSEPEQLARMIAAMEKEIQRSVDARLPRDEQEAEVQLGAEDRESLRALGYFGD